jgi:cell division protein FtsI/penicillin-binding protein 2
VKIRYNWRYTFIASIFTLVGLTILAQMVRIQMTVDVQNLPVPSEMGQWEKAASRRGLILDRTGHLLAGNKTVYSVDIHFDSIAEDAYNSDPKELAESAISIFEIENEYLLQQLRQEPYPPARTITVDQYSSAEEVLEFLETIRIWSGEIPELEDETEDGEAAGEEMDESEIDIVDCSLIPFVSCRPHLTRSYPEGSLASNVLGFVRRDEKRGHLGVEGKYDTSLFGNDRTLWALWDPHKADQAPDPDHGANIILTIDGVLQADVEKILDAAVKQTKSQSGTVVVMHPETGDILAMASSPRADISQYWKEEYKEVIYNTDNAFNYAIKAYEPGSVVKVLTMAAAIDAGEVTPNTKFLDKGKIEIGGVTIRNWNDAAWGPQTMTTCMQHSLNVCLVWVAKQLESEQFYSYFQDFGFGQLTGIELAGEVPGAVKNHLSPEYTRSELGTNAFGQGIEITPVQMLKAISAIANDGEMVAPRIIHSIVDEGYEYKPPRTVVGHPISAETARTMTDMLAETLVEESSLALVPGYSLAGKTGTAEIFVKDMGYISDLTDASFVGWGPTDDPKFIVYVWLHKPSTSIWGSEVAAPVFRKVVEKLVNHMGIPPDAVRSSVVD